MQSAALATDRLVTDPTWIHQASLGKTIFAAFDYGSKLSSNGQAQMFMHAINRLIGHEEEPY